MPNSGPAKLRQRCYDCSPSRLAAVDELPATVHSLPVPAQSPPLDPAGEKQPHMDGETEAVFRKELELLGVADTPDGALILRQARALDDPELPGAQIASLSKSLKSQLNELRETVPPEDDELDEMDSNVDDRLTRRL